MTTKARKEIEKLNKEQKKERFSVMCSCKHDRGNHRLDETETCVRCRCKSFNIKYKI